MKTTVLKVGIITALTATLGLGLNDPPPAGGQAKPDNAPPASGAAPAAAPAGQTDVPAPPAIKPGAAESPAPAQPPEAEAGDPAAPATTNSPAPRLVRSATLPANVKLSPALTEVVKMVQAGVGEEVLLTYITNSTNVFYLGADEIVYLNDLGVSSAVITALIQQDSSPEAQARKQAAVSMNPLPPEMKLTTPATNIYPTTAKPPATGDAVPGNYGYTQPVAAPPPEPTPVQSTPIVTQQVTTVTYFYDSLAPYGNWVSTPDYGLCWQPTVAVVDTSWRPYATNGRWIWTDAGWYWYSYYSWGWAPFHYGRWCLYPRYGWLWVPDLCWGPSWVTWRYTPYYCGWAPLPPGCTYVSGFGLYYSGASVGWSFGFGFGWNAYTFIPTAYLCSPNPHRYYVPAGQAKQIYQNSTVINNYIVGDNNTIINHGIGLDRVSKVHRGEIPKATLRDAPYTRAHEVRMERLERHDTGLAIVRPTLPSQPPISPAVLAARTQSELAKDRPLREPVRATRPSAATGNLVPASSTGSTPPARPDGAPPVSTLPARPDGRTGLAAADRPSAPGEVTRPARQPAAPASPRIAQESVPVVRGTPSMPQRPAQTATPAEERATAPNRAGRAAQEPASRPEGTKATAPDRPAPTAPRAPEKVAPAPQSVPSAPAVSAPTAPARPSRAAQEPASRPTVAAPPSPQPLPSRSAVPGSASPRTEPAPPPAAVAPSRPAGAESTVVSVPQTRAGFVPGSSVTPRSPEVSRPSRPEPVARPVVPVPAPQAVPGNSFYNSRSVAQTPVPSRPSAPVTVVPSAPAPSVRSVPSAPAPSAPVRSFSAPSAPAPARATPAPSSGGGGGRPARPGRE